MFAIFKWFFGAIILIILVYVIFVLLKTFFGFSFFNTTATTGTTGSDVKETVDAGANTLAYKLSHFNLSTWFKDFHPFAYAPMYVEPGERTGFYWGGNSKSFDERWGGGYNSNDDSDTSYGNNTDSRSNYGKDIQVYLANNTTIKNNLVIRGMASEATYTNNTFDVFVLDNYKNTIGGGRAFTNGDKNKNSYIPFRAVISYSQPQSQNGFLLFKNDNSELDPITVIPIYFLEYGTNIQYTNSYGAQNNPVYTYRKLPSMIFISPKYDREYNYNNADYR